MIEVTGIQISRSDSWAWLMYLCRVSFLMTLDLYKAYFGGRHIREYKEIDALFSLKEAIVSLRLRVL